ncbi:MAG TPA: helix-turn-helix transcriptional regulator [Mycobacteriales bacterium]|nr:helix-turn-helix transcriptional regulator [Mycobacteriales bacterium]
MSSPRRTELRSFLRARRARLAPQDVGIAAGPARRTPGLRREEVALLSGVGVTWYTWLEQGRPINASPQVLDAIARALRLDGVERRHLHRLVESAPARPAPPLSAGALLRSFEPMPAILVDARYEILAANQAHRDLFSGWHTTPGPHPNLLRSCVTEPSARDKCLNYDEEIGYLVARLRAEFAHHLDDPQWNDDIRTLRDLAPDFARAWARHEVTEPQPRRRIFRHSEAGILQFQTTELHVGGASDRQIIAYTPLDEDTAARLPRTREPAGATA